MQGGQQWLSRTRIVHLFEGFGCRAAFEAGVMFQLGDQRLDGRLAGKGCRPSVAKAHIEQGLLLSRGGLPAYAPQCPGSGASHPGMRVFQQIDELPLCPVIACVGQALRRCLTHLAAWIMQRDDQRFHRLIVFALREYLHGGAAHAGIVVAKPRP